MYVQWQFEKKHLQVPHIGIYPSEMNVCYTKTCVVNIYSGSVHNHQKLETTLNPSAGEWIKNCDASYNGILLSIKKERTTDTHSNTNEHQMASLCERSQT